MGFELFELDGHAQGSQPFAALFRLVFIFPIFISLQAVRILAFGVQEAGLEPDYLI